MQKTQVSGLAEAAEAEFMYQYESMASPGTKTSLGIETLRIGGGVALSMRNDVTGYWSKALGFGFTEPVTAQLIDQVIDFYRAQHSAGAVIQIAPTALPHDWPEICMRHEIREDSRWIKLACSVGEFHASRSSELRVSPVGPNDLGQWASTALRSFGMPEAGLADMMVAALAHPNFRPFAAWDGDEIVATANLYIHGQIGSLNTGATLPTHRNRGAQSALIAARAKEAANAGCRWLCAETGKPADGNNPSLDNLLRSGLRPLYLRQNWNWSPATRPAGKTDARPADWSSEAQR
jgi:acetyltransferase (GNAT) family protein